MYYVSENGLTMTLAISVFYFNLVKIIKEFINPPDFLTEQP